MKLGDILNPWHALANARQLAEVWKGRADAYALEATSLRSANEVLQRATDNLRLERDVAWAKLGKRSAGISRGNRTRALRRRGGLLPAPINDDTAGASAPHLRTELAG